MAAHKADQAGEAQRYLNFGHLSLRTRRGWVVTVLRTTEPISAGAPLRRRSARGKLKKRLAAAGLLALSGVSAGAWADRSFSHLVSDEVDALFAGSPHGQAVIVTEKMTENLPGPVRRYLDHAGVVGTPIVHTVRLAQRGRMRLAPGLPWACLRAKQSYSVQSPGFVWDGTLYLGRVPMVRARDTYRDGEGKMLVKAASAVTVVDAGGEELDQAALTRYLGEMIWFPSAFLSGNVSFEGLDEGSTRVTLTDRGLTVSGILSIDPEGRLTNFRAERYRMVRGRFELTPWSMPVQEYGVLAGLRLPVRGRAVWGLGGGDFEYIDVLVDQLRYNSDVRA